MESKPKKVLALFDVDGTLSESRKVGYLRVVNARWLLRR